MIRTVRTLGLCLGFAVSVAANALAQPAIRPDDSVSKFEGQRKKDYQALVFTGKDKQDMPFVLLQPSSERKGGAPLIVVLDGGRARSNGQQLRGFPMDLGRQASRREMPCFVLAPLGTGDWTTTRHDDVERQPLPKEPGDDMRLLLELVEHVAREYPVDRARITIVGNGVGGSGALEAAARRPDLFAAAAAYEPTAYTDLGKHLKDTPVMIVGLPVADEPSKKSEPDKKSGGRPKDSEPGNSNAAEDGEVAPARVSIDDTAKSLKAAGATRVTQRTAKWNEPDRLSIVNWMFRQKN